MARAQVPAGSYVTVQFAGTAYYLRPETIISNVSDALAHEPVIVRAFDLVSDTPLQDFLWSSFIWIGEYPYHATMRLQTVNAFARASDVSAIVSDQMKMLAGAAPSIIRESVNTTEAIDPTTAPATWWETVTGGVGSAIGAVHTDLRIGMVAIVALVALIVFLIAYGPNAPALAHAGALAAV